MLFASGVVSVEIGGITFGETRVFVPAVPSIFSTAPFGLVVVNPSLVVLNYR